MAQRFVDQTLFREPARGPAVELGHPLRPHLVQQSSLQQVLEQVVVTVPLPVVVQRRHKEVVALQPLNAGPDVARGIIAASVGGEDVFAQRSAKPVQDGGRQ